jgi:hypothetical protein
VPGLTTRPSQVQPSVGLGPAQLASFRAGSCACRPNFAVLLAGPLSLDEMARYTYIDNNNSTIENAIDMNTSS